LAHRVAVKGAERVRAEFKLIVTQRASKIASQRYPERGVTPLSTLPFFAIPA